jgi:hypothetical protein
MWSPEFIHLAPGTSASRTIGIVLRRLRRFECVLEAIDNLAIGPLHDVDGDAKARIEWWGRLEGGATYGEFCHDLDERDLWESLRDAGSNVVLWHGEHAGEHLFALRACWQFHDFGERVFEVAVETLPGEYITCDAVGMMDPDHLMKAWEHRAPVPDVAARAARWESIRGTPGEWIRTREGDEIVNHKLDLYDSTIIEACRGGWLDSIRVIGHVLAEKRAPGDLLVRWRIVKMLESGALQGRGKPNRFRLPSEVRPSNNT